MPGNRAVATLGALVGGLLASSAYALPGLDVEAGARYWWANPDGPIASQGPNLDTERDLGFDREGTPHFYARLGLPFVILEGEYTRLDYTGKTSGRRFQFGDRTFTTAGNPTQLEAKILHGGGLINLPLPVIDIGLGLGATHFDKEAQVGNERESADLTLPVAKAEIRADFPGLPLNVTVSGQGLEYESDRFYDVTAELGVIWGPLQLRGGYRRLLVDYKEDGLKTDVTFDGPFAGLTLAF